MPTSRNEKGQATIVLVLAMGLVLVGAMGLVIDGARLYNAMQLAQVAADAAATAGIMSMFQGSNQPGSPTYFDTSQASITCSTTDTQLPCQYARMNGFGGSAADHVTIDFPTCTAGAGNPGGSCGYASVLSADSPNQIRVTIQRDVNNSFIRLLGAGLITPIHTSATAAIVEAESPTPIIITHPTLAGSLNENGTSGGLKIIGGPSQSIQVNSSNAGAYSIAQIDLSQAWNGSGANFGTYGGPFPNPGNIDFGTLPGQYIQHSPILDPYRDVAAPAVPATVGHYVTVTAPNYGCQSGSCRLFYPGKWGRPADWGGACPSCQVLDMSGGGGNPNPLQVLFIPGVYYVKDSVNGVSFKQTQGGNVNFTSMCSSGVDCVPDTGGTSDGIVFYDSGPSTANGINSGGFHMTVGNSIVFKGADLVDTGGGVLKPVAPYYGLLFWEDRDAVAHTGGGPNGAHSLGQGNGCFTVIGTIYMTNWESITAANAAHYQAVNFGGTPCGNTQSQGDIIVSTLNFNGNVKYVMTLVSREFQDIRQVALVDGGARP